MFTCCPDRSLKLPKVGDFELNRTIILVEAAFRVPGVVVNEKDVAAGRVAVVEEEVAAHDFTLAVPLHQGADEEIRAEGVEKSICDLIGEELAGREGDAIEFVSRFDRELIGYFQFASSRETSTGPVEELADFEGQRS